MMGKNEKSDYVHVIATLVAACLLVCFISTMAIMVPYIAHYTIGDASASPTTQASEGITMTLPVPRDCEHVVMEARFDSDKDENRNSIFRVTCKDGEVIYDEKLMLDIGLNHDPRSNPDMNGVVKLVFMDAQSIIPNPSPAKDARN